MSVNQRLPPNGPLFRWVKVAYLREAAVVPEVPMMRKAIADIAKLSFLDILLDGIKFLILGDLFGPTRQIRLGFCRDMKCKDGAVVSPVSNRSTSSDQPPIWN